jgi:hypothetical protein
MTSLETGPQEAACKASIPALSTTRLQLRAPRAADAKAITSLINDRRIAENTARIPHPYALADAHAFLAQANRDPREPSFVIALADATIIGGCGMHLASPSSAIGSACPIGDAATRPRPHARFSTMASGRSATSGSRAAPG